MVRGMYADIIYEAKHYDYMNNYMNNYD